MLSTDGDQWQGSAFSVEASAFRASFAVIVKKSRKDKALRLARLRFELATLPVLLLSVFAVGSGFWGSGFGELHT